MLSSLKDKFTLLNYLHECSVVELKLKAKFTSRFFFSIWEVYNSLYNQFRFWNQKMSVTFKMCPKILPFLTTRDLPLSYTPELS